MNVNKHSDGSSLFGIGVCGLMPSCDGRHTCSVLADAGTVCLKDLLYVLELSLPMETPKEGGTKVGLQL